MIRAFQFPQIFDPVRGTAVLTGSNTLTNTTRTLLHVYIGEQRGVVDFGCGLKDFYYTISNDSNLTDLRTDLELAIRRNFAMFPNLLQSLEVEVERGEQQKLKIAIKSPVEINVLEVEKRL